MERKDKSVTHAHYVVTNMERKQTNARTKFEEVLNKQRTRKKRELKAQRGKSTSIHESFVCRESSNRHAC